MKNAESDHAQIHGICLYLAPSSAKAHAFNLTSPERQTGITDFENGGFWIGKKNNITEAQRAQTYNFRNSIFSGEYYGDLRLKGRLLKIKQSSKTSKINQSFYYHGPKIFTKLL